MKGNSISITSIISLHYVINLVEYQMGLSNQKVSHNFN
jgi:hypothetical protein